MDETDMDIIAALQVAPRTPANALSEILGVPTSTINRRLKRLQDEKLLRVIGRFAWPLVLSGNPQQLWLHCHPGQVFSVAEQLKAFPEIQSIIVTSGATDVYADLFPLRGTDLNYLIGKLIPSIPGIASVETQLVLESRRVGQSWRVHRLTDSQTRALTVHRVPVTQPTLGSIEELSDLEFEIMAELGRNARVSAAEVARTLNVSSTTAYRTIQMLLATGAITPRVEVEPAAVGFPLTSLVSLQIKPKAIDEVLHTLATHPAARMVSMVTGKSPVVFNGVFAGPGELAKFLTEDVGGLPGVLAMDTCVSLNILRRYWMDRNGPRIGDQVEGVLRR